MGRIEVEAGRYNVGDSWNRGRARREEEVNLDGWVGLQLVRVTFENPGRAANRLKVT